MLLRTTLSAENRKQLSARPSFTENRESKCVSDLDRKYSPHLQYS